MNQTSLPLPCNKTEQSLSTAEQENPFLPKWKLASLNGAVTSRVQRDSSGLPKMEPAFLLRAEGAVQTRLTCSSCFISVCRDPWLTAVSPCFAAEIRALCSKQSFKPDSSEAAPSGSLDLEVGVAKH